MYPGTQKYSSWKSMPQKTDQEEYGMKPYFDENFDENYETYS